MKHQTDEYTEPPEDVLREMERTLTMNLTSAQTTLDVLSEVDEFLDRYANPAVRAELDAFCAAHGWNTNAFLDGIGFRILSLREAIDAATNHPATTDHADQNAGADHDDKETT